MATELDLFYKSPSEELFDNLTKDQLLEVADKYEIPLTTKDKQLKRTVAVIVKAVLVNLDVLSVGEFAIGDSDGVDQIAVNVSSLSFEQQKDLMLLEIERAKLNREVEIRRLEVEAMRFQLIGEGKLGGSFVGLNVSGKKGLDVANNVKLLPKFSETDVDTFFSLFERLADVMKWPDNEQTLLLQCVLTGKAQKAYSSLNVHDSQNYFKVKDAVLKAYELVPEAYRQKFRNMRKPAEQTYCEFARDLKIQLDRWCAASGANSREDLHELFLLEQFKSTLSEHVSTFLTDRNVTSTENAAILTDEYVLTHKCEVKKGRFKFSDVPTEGVTVSRQGLSEHNRGERNWKSYADKSDRCAYCHLKGHWKKDCLALKGKLMRVKFEHKPVLVVSSVQTDESDGYTDSLQKLEKSVALCNDGDVGYAPFITEGYVSLIGSTEKVPIRILRDTGASESFILESVLPFSQETDTGNRVLIRGIGLQTLSVPLHNVFFQSDLVNRSVVMGVRPSLPVEGVSVILGNNLAGDRVWRDVPSPPVVTTCPTSLGDMDISQQYPEVFVSCALTRAMSKKITDDEKLRDFKGLVKSQRMVPGLLALPSVSHQVWVFAQREDPSLKSLFDAVCLRR